MLKKLRLGVNIDHVATLRNARDGTHPDPVHAAELARHAGADGITAHLREDRRHIRDADMPRLKAVGLPLNFEMAATEEMQRIALSVMPHAVCLVPEKRAEKTTEGGLDVAGQQAFLRTYIQPFLAAGLRVSLFIDANEAQIRAASSIGAPVIELHTGHYAELFQALHPHPNPLPEGEGGTRDSGRVRAQQQAALAEERARIAAGATLAHSLGLEVHAGHGLNYANTPAIAALPEVVELNIGHFLMGEAMFVGLDAAIKKMRQVMDGARA
ncbi:MAG: pyridoxine 5'-phosphate synthase [Azospirillum brasilense]|nr:MAG: pyridoxine 5'-phosphate synthase [Azospirillum brasilense]